MTILRYAILLPLAAVIGALAGISAIQAADAYVYHPWNAWQPWAGCSFALALVSAALVFLAWRG